LRANWRREHHPTDWLSFKPLLSVEICEGHPEPKLQLRLATIAMDGGKGVMTVESNERMGKEKRRIIYPVGLGMVSSRGTAGESVRCKVALRYEGVSVYGMSFCLIWAARSSTPGHHPSSNHAHSLEILEKNPRVLARPPIPNRLRRGLSETELSLETGVSEEDRLADEQTGLL